MQADILKNYLRDVGPKPWRFGEADCGQFAWGFIDRAAGSSVVASVPPYSTPIEVRDIIRRAGGLRRLGRRLADQVPGLIEIDAPPDRKFRYGDIGVLRVGRKAAFAICAGGDEWILKTDRGVATVRTFLGAPATVLLAWRYGHAGAPGADIIGALVIAAVEAITAVGVPASFQFLGATLYTANIIGSVILAAPSTGIAFKEARR